MARDPLKVGALRAGRCALAARVMPWLGGPATAPDADVAPPDGCTRAPARGGAPVVYDQASGVPAQGREVPVQVCRVPVQVCRVRCAREQRAPAAPGAGRWPTAHTWLGGCRPPPHGPWSRPGSRTQPPAPPCPPLPPSAAGHRPPLVRVRPAGGAQGAAAAQGAPGHRGAQHRGRVSGWRPGRLPGRHPGHVGGACGGLGVCVTFVCAAVCALVHVGVRMWAWVWVWVYGCVCVGTWMVHAFVTALRAWVVLYLVRSLLRERGALLTA